MRLTVLSCLAAGAAAPVLASAVCEEAWFSRNLIFDRAGYCFGSNLGQALFNNADCTTNTPDITKNRARKVNQIKEFESELGCAIDTSASALRFFDETARLRALRDLPVMDRLGSGCIGYRGADIVLRNGHRPRADIIGRITAGDSIGFNHWSESGWDYVQIYQGPNTGAHGWADMSEVSEDSCTQWAG